jgi:hypothetical protein
MESRFSWRASLVAGLLIGLGTVPRSGAAIVSASFDANGDISQIVVERGGTDYTYSQSDLIGISLTEVNAEQAASIVVGNGDAVPGGTAANAGPARDATLEDWSVETGVVNIQDNPIAEADGATPQAARTGLAFSFDQAVVNSDDADVIIIELGTDSQTADDVALKTTAFTDDTDGVEFTNSSAALASVNYDRYTADQGEVENLDNLRNFSFTFGNDNLNDFRVYGIEVDLDDLGVSSNATASDLLLRAASGSANVDPVLIFGLPAIPEPGSLALLAGGAVWLLRRRR